MRMDKQIFLSLTVLADESKSLPSFPTFKERDVFVCLQVVRVVAHNLCLGDHKQPASIHQGSHKNDLNMKFKLY